MSHGTDDNDPLLRSLRDLPVHPAPSNGARAARTAFTNAFAPWHHRAVFGLARGVVPVALASIVGLYLSWAFSMALAVQN